MVVTCHLSQSTKLYRLTIRKHQKLHAIIRKSLIMSSPRSFNSLKPWFKKRTSHNNSAKKTYENVATVDGKPVSGYYGFKLYFPVLGNSLFSRYDRGLQYNLF